MRSSGKIPWVVGAALTLTAAGGAAQEEAAEPTRDEAPAPPAEESTETVLQSGAARGRVYVGVYLHDVNEFDQKNGVFDVDVELWVKWRGDFDPNNVQIANAADVERTFLGRDDDRDWHSARWRVRGTMRGEFPLHAFPFDRQTLPVTFELAERWGELAPDLASSGMAERFSLTDWLYEPAFQPAVTEQEFASDLGNLVGEGESTTVSRVSFAVRLERPIVPVVLKIFLPLAIICLVAIAALFLAPLQIEARSAMGVTALLSCFAFQFTVSDSLPAVAYITLADTLFIIGYVLSSVAIVVTVIAYGLEHGMKRRAAVWVDRVFRLVLPLATAGAVFVAIPAPPAEPEETTEPFPLLASGGSDRDVVKIGTTMLSRLSGSPPSIAASWPLVYDDPRDGPRAVFVERRPGVDNDAIRFLAGGEVEVTWRLREGVKWSDGAEVTSADVVFALEASPDSQIAEYVVGDERTLTIRWRDRLARALEPPPIWPAHALRDIYHGDPGGYDAVTAHRREHAIPTLGPYRIAEYAAGERVVAEANEHFLGPPPSIARVELEKLADGAAIVDAYEAGEIDIIVPNSVSVEEAEGLRESSPDAVQIRPSAFHVLLHPDLAHPLLGQLRVRRAILMAIDRERIAREVYGPAGRVAHVPVPGPPPDGAEITAYDIEAARAVLEEAGAIEETFPLAYQPSPTSNAIVDALVRDLSAVGLVVERREVPSTLVPWRDSGHGGLVLHTLRGTRDATPQRYWNLRLVDGAYPPDARNEAYTDDIQSLVDREARALYPERREQLRDALFVEYSKRLPNIPLLFAAERMIARPTLHGWQQDAAVAFGRGLERWYFRE